MTLETEVNEEVLASLKCFSISPSLKYCMISGRNERVTLYSLKEQIPIYIASLFSPCSSIEVCWEIGLLFTADRNKPDVQVWKMKGKDEDVKMEQVVSFRVHKEISAMKYIDNRLLVCGTHTGSVTICTLGENREKAICKKY